MQCSVGTSVNIEKLDGEELISGREAGESGNLSTKYSFFHQLSPLWEEGEVGGGGGEPGDEGGL